MVVGDLGPRVGPGITVVVPMVALWPNVGAGAGTP